MMPSFLPSFLPLAIDRVRPSSKRRCQSIGPDDFPSLSSSSLYRQLFKAKIPHLCRERTNESCATIWLRTQTKGGKRSADADSGRSCLANTLRTDGLQQNNRDSYRRWSVGWRGDRMHLNRVAITSNACPLSVSIRLKQLGYIDHGREPLSLVLATVFPRAVNRKEEFWRSGNRETAGDITTTPLPKCALKNLRCSSYPQRSVLWNAAAEARTAFFYFRKSVVSWERLRFCD